MQSTSVSSVDSGSSASDAWLSSFTIPDTFSTRAMECIRSGIVSQSARTEIIQTLATLIWVHTHYPSKEAYNTICSRLVTKYPTLGDDADDDLVPYVSTYLFVVIRISWFF